MWIDTILITIIILSVIADFFLIIYAYEKRNLKKDKIHLTKLLEKSEESRIKIEAEKNKTALVFNNFTDGIIIIDEKDKIFSINPEAEKILELDINKLLGKPFQFLEYFPKAKPIELILSSGLKNISKKEVESAEGLIMELSVIPLNLGRNDTNHLIVLHDVSKEKIIERMKTEFVSLTAHQLRTPLSAIKWSMSMLRKGDFEKLTKKQSEVVKNIYQNNERLISLVNDLLDVAHIEEGRYLYKTNATDIREIIMRVIDSCKDELKKRKLKIVFGKPNIFPQIILDEEKIRLVIQNFVDNAIKYSTKDGKIIISLKNDDKNIELKVQDFGIGIPKNQQDKIFLEFFRGSNAIKMSTIGSGLGLFLSKNIIEAHGGKIWFESEENVGTGFYFSLPIKKI
ncbi:MAG: HAMP domain-containing sensor histidine kinase [Candidatus Staskawiczbacteria bacterium]|nr:HAMP domain-containing sensor histidine kinase [Candidatus Staskawiczbacteria bacterium]